MKFSRTTRWAMACALLAGAAPLAAAPVTGWIVDPDTGGSQSKISAGAATDSPVIGTGAADSAAAVAIYAPISGPADALPDVSLAVGQQVTLSGQVTLAGIVSSRNQFRFGLFNEAGPAVDNKGWLGYLGNNSSGNDSQSGSLSSRDPAGTDFATTTFISTTNGRAHLLGTSIDGGNFTSGAYNFSLTVARLNPVNLTINASLTSEQGWVQEWTDAVETSASRITYNFNRVGFLSGGSMSADQVSFSGIDVTASQIPTLPVLTLRVTTSGPNAGSARIVNTMGEDVDLVYYEITGDAGALSPTLWTSLDDHERGDAELEGWDEAAGVSSKLLSEVVLSGHETIAAGEALGLGRPILPVGQSNLSFKFALPDNDALLPGIVEYVPGGPAGDFDADGDVDSGDLKLWSSDLGLGGGSDANGDHNTDGADLLAWQQTFTGPAATPAMQPVPESATDLLALAAVLMGGMAAWRRPSWR